MSAVQPSYDDTAVPAYTLPDPLIDDQSQPVTSAQAWRTRREQILELFRQHVFGRHPRHQPNVRFNVFDQDTNALDGLATRRQVTLQFGDKPNGPSLDLLLYLPNARSGPAPVFVGLNFHGNHTVHPDPGIRLSTRWMRAAGPGVVDHRATDAARGTQRRSWYAEDIVRHGYGLVTAYYGDLAPDDPDHVDEGVRSLFHTSDATPPAGDAWGAVGTWAWGLIQAMSYLETDEAVDARRVIAMGHSRLGKTALWAGAQDERFALVISNHSGCTGAALSRRCIGETVDNINTAFPHWFCDNYQAFANREHELPVDQHMLIALQAPRPVLVCSAEEDQWADPRGEFLSAYHAGAVYRLLGKDAIADDQMPALDHLLDTTVGYRIRPGGHGVRPDDWQAYLRFADKHLEPAK